MSTKKASQGFPHSKYIYEVKDGERELKHHVSKENSKSLKKHIDFLPTSGITKVPK